MHRRNSHNPKLRQVLNWELLISLEDVIAHIYSWIKERVQDGELVLSFRPVLPGWLFDEHDQVSFNFLGCIPVRYHNPTRADTWKLLPRKIMLHLVDGQSLDFHDPDIPAPYANMVRNQDVQSIVISFAI